MLRSSLSLSPSLCIGFRTKAVSVCVGGTGNEVSQSWLFIVHLSYQCSFSRCFQPSQSAHLFMHSSFLLISFENSSAFAGLLSEDTESSLTLQDSTLWRLINPLGNLSWSFGYNSHGAADLSPEQNLDALYYSTNISIILKTTAATVIYSDPLLS